MGHKGAVVIVLCCVASLTHSANLPKSWTKCRRSDVNREECLKNAAQVALNSLFNGEKSLNLPPIDPLFIPQTIIIGSGNVNAEVFLTNYTVSGYKSARFDTFKFDCNKLQLTTNITMEGDVVVYGDYNIVGKILVLPVSGKGKAKISVKGLKLYVKLAMSTIKKSAGVSHYRIDSSSFKLDAAKVYFRLGNLFNGNKQLADSTNRALNENWRTLLEDLKPSMEREFGKIMTMYPRSVFEKIPSSELCPN